MTSIMPGRCVHTDLRVWKGEPTLHAAWTAWIGPWVRSTAAGRLGRALPALGLALKGTEVWGHTLRNMRFIGDVEHTALTLCDRAA